MSFSRSNLLSLLFLPSIHYWKIKLLWYILYNCLNKLIFLIYTFIISKLVLMKHINYANRSISQFFGTFDSKQWDLRSCTFVQMFYVLALFVPTYSIIQMGTVLLKINLHSYASMLWYNMVSLICRLNF